MPQCSSLLVHMRILIFQILTQVRVDLNERRQHEIAMRRNDMKALKIKLDALLEQSKHVEEASDPVVVDLFQTNKLIANHEATIKEILEQCSKQVPYQKNHCKSSLTLQLGVISKVPRSFLRAWDGDSALLSTVTFASSRDSSCSVATPSSLSALVSSSPSKMPSISALSSSLSSSRIDNEEYASLVWTIEPFGSEVAVTSDEFSTESVCEELPVVNGVIQPAAAASAAALVIVIFLPCMCY
jgi:hypothetical protein